MRIWISATCLLKSLAMSNWPKSFIQCIFVSTRLLQWYPLHRRHNVRPRQREALTASFRATAPELVGFHGLAFFLGGDDSVSATTGNGVVAFAVTARLAPPAYRLHQIL